MQRIKTGIIGLDELIEGGFVKGSSILIQGAPGAGKTIFSLQFLLEGLRSNEKGAYFSLEEPVEDILKDVERFGWREELEKAIQQRNLLIINLLPTSLENVRSEIIKYVDMIKASRVAIDSVTILKTSWEEYKDIGKIRRILHSLILDLKRRNVTTLLLSELRRNEIEWEEFIVDGVIKLYYLAQNLPRALQITKMRRTKHSLELFPFEITESGIVVRTIKF
ncbi:MAG: ATPase domain-containing protein [Candidatus Aenigmatarchaeota archaeon]